MPYARTDDGVRIYYETHGSGGRPLVLADGIGGNADTWDVNRDGLAATRRLILWEPRGHGRSGSPADPARYSFTRWVLDLRDLLDHLGIARAHVGGLSLGGGIACRFALRYPTRGRSLVVTNSSSAAGRPLSVDNLVMRARSLGITLGRGVDAMAEYAMAENPNLAERLAFRPEAKARVLRPVPAAQPHRLRELAAGPPGHGPHHRQASPPGRAPHPRPPRGR